MFRVHPNTQQGCVDKSPQVANMDQAAITDVGGQVGKAVEFMAKMEQYTTCVYNCTHI